MPRKSRLAMIVLGLSIFGGGMWGASKIAPQIYHEDYQLTAFHKNGNAPIMTDQWVKDKAQYDFLAFASGVWGLPGTVEPRKELQKQNLDIMIGSWFTIHTAPQWAKRSAEAGHDNFGARWWNAVSPYLARTTECDTAAIWLNNYTIDLFNPVLRTAAIGVIDNEIRLGKLDWVILDFINVPLPNLKKGQDPIYEEMEHGDLDFDMNGIGHWDDPAEQAQLRVVWDLYIDEMRATFPPNVLIIPNGSLAIQNAAFAQKTDGCYIEGFPRWFFGSQPPNWPNVYDPAYPHSLWNLSDPERWYTDNYYVMLEDMYDEGNLGYVSMLFDRVVELKIQKSDDVFPSDPIEFDAGQAAGVAYFTEGNKYLQRDFKHGTIKCIAPFTTLPTYEYVPLEPDEPDVPEEPTDDQITVFAKWGNTPPFNDPGWEEDMAQYDFIVFTYGNWHNQYIQESRKEIEELSPDIHIGDYMPVHTAGPWMRRAYELGQDNPAADYWEAAHKYLAVTTEGDTASIWKNHPLIDLFNPECRKAVVAALAKNAKEQELDWYHMDFFQVPMPNLKRWQDPIYEEMEHGDLDFDRDGIGHWDDPDEQQELRKVFQVYMEEIRAAMPKDMLLIPNGSLAMKDAGFASLVDGCYIEGFPRWFFGTQEPNYPNALDPEYFNSMFVLSDHNRWHGKEYYVLVEDMFNVGDFEYIAEMFDGGAVVKIWNDHQPAPDTPKELNTGYPLTKPEFSKEKDLIKRSFSNGTLYIENISTNAPTYRFDRLPIE